MVSYLGSKKIVSRVRVRTNVLSLHHSMEDNSADKEADPKCEANDNPRADSWLEDFKWREPGFRRVIHCIRLVFHGQSHCPGSVANTSF